MTSALIALALTALVVIPARAAAPFDGVWHVSMVCPTAADGTFGYTHQFTAQVTNGALHGEFGQRSTPGWVALDGTISASGKAMLNGSGLTGSPSYAVGRPVEQTPYRFHVDAQFEGAHGSGERVETRRCSFEFSKG